MNITTSDDIKWKIQDAARTVMHAEEIKADTKLWPKVQKELTRQADAAKRASLEGKVRTGMKRAFPGR